MTQSDRQQCIGAIEGGGTSFRCAVAEPATGRILSRATFPTRAPAPTLGDCLQFLEHAQAGFGSLIAVGIGCFGPLELRPSSPQYGHLLPTPKPGWSGADVCGPFRQAFDVPVLLDTDVGCAALGEWRAGAGRGKGSVAYVTVGTGIGGAVVPRPGSALMHAEMGHLLVRRDPADDFAGACPFHRDCLEGLAGGPAIRARWGCDLGALAADHPGRAMIARYVAQLAAAILLLHAPERIVIGGGVTEGGALLPEIRRATHAQLAGYLAPLDDDRELTALIVAPALQGDSTLTGAIHLARDALART